MAHPTYQLSPAPTPAAFADATPSAPTAVRALQLWAPAHGLPPSEKCGLVSGALSPDKDPMPGKALFPAPRTRLCTQKLTIR